MMSDIFKLFYIQNNLPVSMASELNYSAYQLKASDAEQRPKGSEFDLFFSACTGAVAIDYQVLTTHRPLCLTPKLLNVKSLFNLLIAF